MQFKTELHCHSSVVSYCGHITPAEIVERYLAHGYTSLVLTDHINSATFLPKKYHGGEDWQERVDFFLSGYHELCREAAGKLNILLGAEVRVDEHTSTDILLYGVTEQILRDMEIAFDDDNLGFCKRAREMGLLVCQAHPFRNDIRVLNPTVLDGVEVYNGNPRIDSRNDIARLWAERHGLIATSGTDTHHADRPINGGIVTDFPITSNDELLAVLRSGNYKLLENGEATTL